jgi:hypothetical protein
MGVGGEGDGQSPPGRGGMYRPQIATHVDDQSPPVAQIHQVSRVAKSLVDERNQIDSGHCTLS